MFALILAILGPASAGEWIDIDTYEAPTTTIKIDGNNSDWNGVDLLTGIKFLTKEGKWVVFEEYNGGVWKGKDDHTSSIGFAWDTDYLYIYTYVIDDEHQNNNSWFDGDAIQLVFADDNRSVVKQLYNYALDDSQRNILIGNETATAGGLTADDVAIVRDDKKKTTVYESRFSPKILGLNKLGVGTKIGIGICVNDGDRDTPGQRGWDGWGPHAAVHGKDAPKTGLVKLSDKVPKAVEAIGKLANTWGRMKVGI